MGNDLTRERNLAWYLATTTSNKPAYGWAKRHCDDPKVAKALALALGEAIHEETEKAVALLMWAGADSHRKVQSLRWGSDVDDGPDDDYTSAVKLAVELGHGKLLKYLKPDPTLDDFNELLGVVCGPDAVDHLAARCSSIDWSSAIVRITRRMAFPILEKKPERNAPTWSSTSTVADSTPSTTKGARASAGVSSSGGTTTTSSGFSAYCQSQSTAIPTSTPS